MGGSVQCENLMLLCAVCHIDSEGIPNFWNWFNYKRTHDWRSKVQWVIKRLEQLGYDVDHEADLIKDYSWQERMKYTEKLLDIVFKRTQSNQYS